jgi:hypothetical protein
VLMEQNRQVLMLQEELGNQGRGRDKDCREKDCREKDYREKGNRKQSSKSREDAERLFELVSSTAEYASAFKGTRL